MTTFSVNGRSVTVGAHPDTPLLTVLRDELGLLGSRFGCGMGLCGACAVNLDGTVVHACDTPLWQAEGLAVTTVEGLSVDGRPHPVQRSVLEHQAAQCGFCISGILVRAAALLDEDPRPEASTVARSLDGHLCRCGVQRRIIDAVVAAGRDEAGTA